MMGEAAVIMKSLWTEERTTFEGKHYQLKDAMCEPKPIQQPRIPLWIGGSGERVTMRHVAKEADGWNTFLTPLDEFDHKLSVLDGHCADVGRERSDIRIQLVMQAVSGPMRPRPTISWPREPPVWVWRSTPCESGG